MSLALNTHSKQKQRLGEHHVIAAGASSPGAASELSFRLARRAVRGGRRVVARALAVPGLLVLGCAAAAGDPGFWDDRFFLSGINGTVNAIVAGGGNLYVGGSFTAADGVAATNIGRWDGTRWSPLGTGLNGAVNALAVRGPDLFAGGAFTVAGGVGANRVARWDGTNWHALGSGIGSNEVKALAVSGGQRLYVAGDFISAGGVNATNVAQWDGSQWSALGGGVTDVYQAYASALAVIGNDLYVGGYFTEAGRVNADNLARWDGVNWYAVGGGVNDSTYPAQVAALAASGGYLYAGGSFSSAGNVTASNIARWDGTNWMALGAGLGRYYGDLTVTALAVDGGKLVAGGRFVTAGGIRATNVATWEGGVWSETGGGMAGTVKAVGLSGSDLYAGGLLAVGTNAVPNALGKWTGTNWALVSAGGGQGLRGSGTGTSQGDGLAALIMAGGRVYAGGSFLLAGSLPAENLARWDGTRWSPLGQGLDGPVYALAVSNPGSEPSALNPLYVAGKFATAGGFAASNVAQWDGTHWSACGTGLNGTVYALAASPATSTHRHLYAGGAFTGAGSVRATNVACWDGTAWSALGTGIDGPVYALTIAGSNLLVGGKFTSAGGVEASNVACWNGSSWSALGSGVRGVVYSSVRTRPPPVSVLLALGTDVYVGGDFAYAGGLAATNVARWDGAQWHALGAGVRGAFNLQPPPTVQAMAADGGALFVGGTFTNAGGAPARNLAKWEAGIWAPVSSSAAPAVAALWAGGERIEQSGTLCVGGRFKSAGGRPASDFTFWHARARLDIARSGAGVQVTWPSAADGYDLESSILPVGTGAGAGAAVWKPVVAAALLVTNRWTVTISNAFSTEFYRLMRP